METFLLDSKDIEFNLFEMIKTQEDCELTREDLQNVVEEFSKFASQEIAPTREPGDVEGVHLGGGVVKTPQCFKAPHKMYYENLWFTLGMSEEYTDLKVPQSIYVACTSILTAANVSYGMYPGLSRAAFNTIEKVGTEQQKKRFLPSMVKGAWGGTMCLTEPAAGSDVGALTTRAQKLDDGSYKISGIKIFISSGDNDLYENIVHLVLARPEGAPAGTKGISLFIVPKLKVDEAGGLTGESNDVCCTKLEEKMGLHAQATSELVFGQNGHCVGYLLGQEGEGMANMFIMMNEARLLCALQGEAQGSLAYLLSVKYAKEREQFGKPIIEHPDVRRMLLKMRSLTRGMRALGLYAAKCLDQLESDAYSEQQKKKANHIVNILTPVCKSYFTDFGHQVCVDAVQVHGGYGYCRDYGVEQLCRDVKIASIYEGTNGIQAIDLVIRKILKDGGVALKDLMVEIEGTLRAAMALKDEALSSRLSVFQKVLGSGQELVGHLGALAQKKQIDRVLFKCNDTLEFFGHLLLAWCHLSAVVRGRELKAQEAFSGQGGSQYLEEREVDFSIFCDHYLTKNFFLAQLIGTEAKTYLEAKL